MSFLQLEVTDRNRSYRGACSARFAERVFAALAAEPETLDELAQALERFIPSDRITHRLDQWLNDDPRTLPGALAVPDSRILLDLPGRVLAKDLQGWDLYRVGSVYYDAEERILLPYDVPSDWTLLNGCQDYQDTCRRQRAVRPTPLDTRPILYGEFIPFLVEHPLRSLSSEAEARTREIHLEWMTTPRLDLAGKTPSDVLHARHREIDQDRFNQEEYWSRFGKAPPALSPESAAYRHAAYGSQENIVYYDLLRYLIRLALQRADQRIAFPRASEIDYLREAQETWLTTFDPECELVPHDYLDAERSRLPFLREFHMHVGCAACEAWQETTPSFVFFDDLHMDPHPAFRVLPELSAAEEDLEFTPARPDAHPAPGERDSTKGPPPIPDERLWHNHQRYSTLQLPPGLQATIDLMEFGSMISELQLDLQQAGRLPHSTTRALRKLADQFTELCSAFRFEQPQAVKWRSTQLQDVLEWLAEQHPEIEAKCADFAARLRGFHDRGVGSTAT